MGALRRAADARADAGERFVVTDDATGVGVGGAGLDGPADVDLVGEVVPGGRVGEAINEAAASGLMFGESLMAGSCRGVRSGRKVAP